MSLTSNIQTAMTELLERPESNPPESPDAGADQVPANPNDNMLRLVGLSILAVVAIVSLVMFQSWVNNQPDKNSNEFDTGNVEYKPRSDAANDDQTVTPPQRRLLPRGRARVNSVNTDPEASTMKPAANRINR